MAHDGDEEADPSLAEFLSLMNTAAGRVADFLSHATDRPIRAKHSVEEIQSRLSAYTFEGPIESAKALNDCADMLERWNLDTTHPRHFGWFNPSPHLTAVVASALVSAY